MDTPESLVMYAIKADYWEQTGEEMDEHMEHANKLAADIVSMLKTGYRLVPRKGNK